MEKPQPVGNLVKGIKNGDRATLSRAITLTESRRKDDRASAEALLTEILPMTGASIRIGITGVPGAGKSTFIEAFGTMLTAMKKKVAVLAIDPSSTISGGSILGDKTRMPGLAKDPLAYVRPSPAGDASGGVALRTRENLLLCEAAGFDIVLVETIGVGQAEVDVKQMVDFFLLLLPPGGGDELQGMKRGIVEMADGFVITKADGDLTRAATKARAAYQQAIHLFPATASGWVPPVLLCSAYEAIGIKEVWDMLLQYKQVTESNNYWYAQRQVQNVSWFHDQFKALVFDSIQRNETLTNARKNLEDQLMSNAITPTVAAKKLWELMGQDPKEAIPKKRIRRKK